MVTFELAGGGVAAALVRGLRQIRLAPSFGDVSTTIASPGSVPEKPAVAGMPDGSVPAGLLRLSPAWSIRTISSPDLRRGLDAAAQQVGGRTCE